ncbi:MAG TPA: hypothetical protein P5267_02385 [Patescibacteria group bacterium]|nr:hypothetical protein [Patescibacteria group bacterium]
MLNKKLIIILIVVVVIALIVAGILIFLNKKQTVDNNANTNTTVNNNNNNNNQTLPTGGEGENINQPATNNSQNTNQPVAKPVNKAEVEAVNLAKFFVEMIGSYSPEARFQNVIDLQPMMTESMVKWSVALIEKNLPNLDSNQESITTRVFKTEMVSFSGERAKILLTTRRTKTESNNVTNYSQDAEVDLVKVGAGWKVSNLIWK